MAKLVDRLVGEATGKIKPDSYYARERNNQADLMRRRRAAARDIELPPIKDQARRESCRNDLILFQHTYFPHKYDLEQADFQIKRVQKAQELVLFGGQTADAHPRGTGKTTDAITTALWATLYGHKRHFFVIRKSDDEGEKCVADIKAEMETNAVLAEDFPEVCIPVRDLAGAPQRASAQTVNGVRTRMKYHSNYIVMPTVEGSECSGSVISSSGILNVRGWSIEGLRPDFCLLDDVESEDSVESPTTQRKIENMVLKAVGGLSGPGKSNTILWRGTIIKRGCLIDQFTDRAKHPEWQGSRQAAIIAWPTRVDMWEEYLQMYREDIAEHEDSTARRACQYYADHREEMDAGAVLAWPARYNTATARDGSKMELSNLQHCYNTIALIGEDAFATEYQNDPPKEKGALGLTPEIVQSRVSGVDWNIVPERCNFKVVQALDIRADEIHYTVMAFAKDSTSSLIDYGIIQTGHMRGGVKVSNDDAEMRHAIEMRVLYALRERFAEIDESTPYLLENGKPRGIDLTLIDSNWNMSQKAVYQFCLESGPRWKPARGCQTVAGMKKYTTPTAKNNAVEVGDHWYASWQERDKVWLFSLDADYWKMTLQQRLLQDPTTPGAMTLYGSKPLRHRAISGHFTSEEWDVTHNRWVQRSAWNHWFDCGYMCFAAAAMLGVSLLRKREGLSQKARKRVQSAQLPGIRTRY